MLAIFGSGCGNTDKKEGDRDEKISQTEQITPENPKTQEKAISETVKTGENTDQKQLEQEPALKKFENMPPFRPFFQEFMKAWNSKNIEKLNPFIHPDYGLFVLQNPGAYLYPFYGKDASVFKKEVYGYEYRAGAKCPTLLDGKLPDFSCDTEGWDKEGCFLEEGYHTEIAPLMALMGEYDLGKGKNEASYPVAQKIDNLETMAVYSTDDTVGWNFGFIDGKWYLVMVDMEDPCSA